MSELEEIGKKLMGLDGVNGFVITSNDRQTVISQNIDDAEKLASCIVFSAMNCQSVKQVVGMTKLRYFMFTTDAGDHLVVLPLKKSLVGVMKSSEIAINDLIVNFNKIVRAVYQ